MRQPNILLLMCDQFRGDCLSIQNHPDVKTPFLDSIGHQGVVFENAYSATPSCIPARAALLTGRSQEGHGRVGYQDNVDWDYTHYMAEEFSNADYQTQCIGKMHVHPPRLSCGFQSLKLHDGYLACYRDNKAPTGCIKAFMMIILSICKTRQIASVTSHPVGRSAIPG